MEVLSFCISFVDVDVDVEQEKTKEWCMYSRIGNVNVLVNEALDLPLPNPIEMVSLYQITH